MEQPSYPFVSNTVLGSPEPQRLARFYLELLGWRYRDDEHDDPDWVVIKPQEGGTGLSFQREEHHERPVWPTQQGTQQMQLHLDIAVGDDLDHWVAAAERLGATRAAWQPQPLVRVMHDPDGHVFCLFAPGG